MDSIHDKLHALIDKSSDPILLENIYTYLSAGVSQQKQYLKDELSEAEYNALMESKAQYRSGPFKTHEEVLECCERFDPEAVSSFTKFNEVSPLSTLIAESTTESVSAGELLLPPQLSITTFIARKYTTIRILQDTPSSIPARIRGFDICCETSIQLFA